MPFMWGALFSIFALCAIFIVGIHFKHQVATPLAIMLPGGRLKPLIVGYSIIFCSIMVITWAATKIPDGSSLGTFAFITMVSSIIVFAQDWHYVYAAFFLYVPYSSQNVCLDIIQGRYIDYVPGMILAGLLIYGYLAYRILSISEESTEYRFKWEITNLLTSEFRKPIL
jgi:hypothetical protein